MYDPCAYCFYSSLQTDCVGHDYFQCDLDDDPNLHSNALCCQKPDDLPDDLEID